MSATTEIMISGHQERLYLRDVWAWIYGGVDKDGRIRSVTGRFQRALGWLFETAGSVLTVFSPLGLLTPFLLGTSWLGAIGLTVSMMWAGATFMEFPKHWAGAMGIFKTLWHLLRGKALADIWGFMMPKRQVQEEMA